MNHQPEKFIFDELETERVVLSILTLADSKEVFRHFSDPDVARFVELDEGMNDIHDAEKVIRFHLEDSGCRWGIFEKIKGRLIGTCGFHCWLKAEGSCVEVGYDLEKQCWGKGIMQEVLSAVIEYGFSKMELSRIEAPVDPANYRSIALLERLGFLREKELRKNLICYYVLREKWVC
ncbi:MAG: GNAT family N-acetyltransferase [Planctomycetota bacterium]|jgi:ribosomal-protein-alanine N-acetyltransferase